MIRHLPRVIALMLTAGAAGLFTSSTSHAAQATLHCPATVQTGEQLVAEVTVDVGTMPLGAYSLTVTHDPTVMTNASVAGGNGVEFAGTPTTNTGSVASGSTKISAFQTSSLTGPTGIVSVSRLTFNVGGTTATTTALGLTVDHLFDTSSNPIAATATGCLVRVIGGTATCPASRGFWKHHPSAWPVMALMLGSQTYSQSELLGLLTSARHARSDASVALARQLVAAKLNIANGSDPTISGTTVADADRLLAVFAGKLPYGVKRTSALGQSMVSDRDLLERYNSGRQTPTCVRDGDSPARSRFEHAHDRGLRR
jgi:hypothetical protein